MIKEKAKDAVVDLEAFHRGERAVLSQVYRRYVASVEGAVSRYCRGVDAECLVHDVFVELIDKAHVRCQFKGGNMDAWLRTIAAHRAIDYLRRQRRWVLLDEPHSLEGKLEPVEEEESLIHRDQQRKLRRALERFSHEVLPDLDGKLQPIVALRFEQGLSQVAAAKALGIPRSTYIEREQRLFARLSRFFSHVFGEG